MRVLLDGRPLRGRLSGVGQYVLYLARGLGARQDVDVTALTFDFLGRSNPLLDDVRLADSNVREHRRRLLHRKVFNGISAYTGAVPRELLGIPAHDLVHVTYFERFARPARHETVVSTVHDVAFLRMPETFSSTNLAASRRALLDQIERSDVVITVSEFTRRELIELTGIDADRVAVTPLAATSRPVPREHGPGAGGRRRPYALFVGNVEPRKNLPTLISAWRSGGYGRDHDLVVCGAPLHLEGPSMSALIGAESDGVQYLGYVSSAEKSRLLAGAACFVYPSLYEGFGIPVLEAMASGVPVVASTAVDEVAGGAALLAAPRDVDGLRDAIGAVLHDEGMGHRLTDAGLTRAREFSWERTAALTADAYRRATSQVGDAP